MAENRRARNAEALNKRSHEATLRSQEARAAEARKTTRLRALRLTKEAADRAAVPTAAPTRRREITR